MKYDTLKAAVAEAKRFIATAEKLIADTPLGVGGVLPVDIPDGRGYWGLRDAAKYLAVKVGDLREGR